MNGDPLWTRDDDASGGERPSILLALAVGGIALLCVVGVFVAVNAWFGTVDELRAGTLSLLGVLTRWVLLWVGVFLGLAAGLALGYLLWRRVSPDVAHEGRTREWRTEEREAVREVERLLRGKTHHGN